jgi:hypothetical protein
MGSLFARRLKLLRFPAQSTYLYCACFGDEITHIEILSRFEALCPSKINAAIPIADRSKPSRSHPFNREET